MTDVESNQYTNSEFGVEQAPAIGLIGRPESGDAIAGAILRAQRHGHQAVVTASEAGLEALEYARQLDAVVVPPTDSTTTGTEPRSELSTAAKEVGFPGLIIQEDPTMRVDFAASKEALLDSDSFSVDAQRAPRVDGTHGVMVAIPAYNEASTIADVVREATAHAETVVVIDDGSEDDTVARAEKAGADTIVHETNRGYGAALKTAFQEANRAGIERLVILDGDGQHDPADIPKLLAEQREADAELVIGSRFTEHATTDAPLYRRVGLSIVNTLTNLSLGVVRSPSWIQDTQSGFRVYNRPAIESLADDETIGDRMSASTDILYHAHQHDYDIIEVGTEITYDVDSASSHHPVSHGVTLVMNLLRTIEQDRPVTALGIPGFVFTLIGIGFGYWTFANYITSGTFPLGSAVTSVFFTLIGIFACFTAIILHSLNTHLGDHV